LDFASILNNEITHLVFALIAGVAVIVAVVALLMVLSQRFRK